MKKQILNIGKALNKKEQKAINGGNIVPCPCTETYTDNGDGSCSYPAFGPTGSGPFGLRCWGSVNHGQCCIL